jgi:hypothetical protein
MSALILFRSSNFDGNSKLIYELPGGMSLKGKKVGLQGFSFYNSFFNISSTLGNNTITFKFPNYSAANVYTMKSFVWTISDGFYTWVQFNDALTQWLNQI